LTARARCGSWPASASICQRCLSHEFDVLGKRLEVPRRPVNVGGDGIDQAEILRVLREHRRKRAWNNVSDAIAHWETRVETGRAWRFAAS
jgi:hypothetical protein